MSLWSRFKGAVLDVLGLAPTPPPLPVVVPEVEELLSPGPFFELRPSAEDELQLGFDEELQLDIEEEDSPAEAVVIEEEEVFSLPSSSLRAEARTRALGFIEREQVEKAAQVELGWWDRLELAPGAERAARAEQSLAAQLGTTGAGRGHPGLLPPLELLQNWGGLSEAQAVRELARLTSLVGEEAAGDLAELRSRALDSFRSEMGAKPPPPLVAAPGVRQELQGSPISSAGAVEDVVSLLWDKWVRSTLSGPGVAPPSVTLGLGDLPGEMAQLVAQLGGSEQGAGWVLDIPGEVWVQGPDAVLAWLEQADILADWIVTGEIDRFDADDSKETKV